VFVNADGGLGLFENGLRQNVLFLQRLFSSAPGCAKVWLLNHGDGEPGPIAPELGLDPADIVRTAQVADQLDFVIVLGAAMDRDTALRLRERGCRVIAYKGGNGAVISMEAMAANPPRGDAERYFDADFYDAVWITPQHWEAYASWCRTMYRAPVHQVPQVWSPLLIEAMAPERRAAFAYRPGRRPWRVGLMDPNITVMKTSHMGMLACEAAWRVQSERLAAIYVSNGWPHRDKPHFNSFYRALGAARAGVMTLEPRFQGVDFLADHCDALVTHHWGNGLNYLYWEALYGGYPLIHNSEFLDGLGYRYADFDAEDGGRALLLATEVHDDGLEAYRQAAGARLAELAPETTANVAVHEGLLAL
jgi:hypothetical protein